MAEIEKIMPLAFFKKEHFSGSLKGMRYRISKNTDNPDEAKFQVCIWPEPFCFEKTAEDKKQVTEFPFSEDGRELVKKFLNEQVVLQKGLWEI